MRPRSEEMRSIKLTEKWETVEEIQERYSVNRSLVLEWLLLSIMNPLVEYKAQTELVNGEVIETPMFRIMTKEATDDQTS